MNDDLNKNMRGIVAWALRNEDGSVARSGFGENLVVDNGKLHPSRSVNSNYPTGRYLFIANDQHDVVPYTNQFWRAIGSGASFENTTLDTGTGGWNRSTLTRTVSGTFIAPSAQRTVTHIGLSYSSGGQTNGVIGQVFSALEVSPPIVQEVTQTLEVTYKIIVLPQNTKGLKRFARTWRHMNRNWLEMHLVDHINTYYGWLMPYTFGKFHFVDEDAQMLTTFEQNGQYTSNWHISDGSPPSSFSLQNTINGYYSDGHTITAAEDNRFNGAFGMTVSGENANAVPRDATTFENYVDAIGLGYYPLAQDWGKVGPLVFPHPIGRIAMFNEVAIDKTGQGDLEIEGPYIPKDAANGAPTHWAYNVVVTDSGDADPGTEGTYMFRRHAWYSRAFSHTPSLRTGGTGTYTYVADGGGGNSVITQASGDFRHTDNFMPDSRLEISGTVSNNGTTFRIIKVEALTLTLEGVVLTGEGPVASSLQAVDLFRPSTQDDRLQEDSNGASGWNTRYIRHERYDSTEGTTDARYNLYRQVWDGIDTFWGLHYRNLQGDGTRHTMVRWRAMTGEQEFRGTANNENKAVNASENRNPLLDTTRFVKHTDGLPIGDTGLAPQAQPYALESDRAGLVFYGRRNIDDGAGTNNVYIIDNSKPGRWYQRPSGSVTAGGVFTVDAADEIHAMFPFVGGDAGATPKIRIVNSAQGNDGVYTVSTFNNANEVVLSGSFTAESNIEWQWTTVDETQPAVGELRGLVWDPLNSRLWALGSLGLKHSDDSGQTWSTLLDESTATTPLIDSESRAAISIGSVDSSHGGYAIDDGGDLYWISNDSGGTNEYWVNKLELNSGIGVDSVHSRIGLTADFPASAQKPTTLSCIVWERGLDNPNKLGALWFFRQETAATVYSHYRMTIDAGVISAAPQIAKIIEHNPTTITSPTFAADIDSLFRMITLPSGKTYIREYTGNLGWYLFDVRFADDPDNAYQDFGENIDDDEVHGAGIERHQWREDGCFWVTYGQSRHGSFGSMSQPHRLAPAADVGGQSGAAASIVAGAPAGQVRVQGLTGMTADSVGRHLEITGAASGANNSIFIIAAQNSATEVDVFSPNGVTGDANNGSISWQEKESEWVQWEGSEDQFNAWYGTVSKGRCPMHADFRELRDNVKVKFTEAGGATAPADEFVEGERFTFIASFGEHKTNVEDATVNTYKGSLPAETIIEGEAIKNATGSGTKNAYHKADNSFSVPTPQILDPTYIMDANGKNWGTVPYNYYSLYGLGNSVDSDPNDAGDRWSFYSGLDLGAATEIHKLVVEIAQGNAGFDADGNWSDFSQAAAGRANEIHIYSAPDAVTLPTEIDATLRWPASTYALGKHIHVWQEPGAHNFDQYIRYRITVDLSAAGLSAGQRTARFWEIGVGALATNRATHLCCIYALDATDQAIGITSDQYVDEKYDTDFAGMNINEVFWIQNVHGGGDTGGGTVISTTDDGDGDGYTDRVTLDAGVFDTANIDITKDFLAWQEPGAPTSAGYLRATDRPGNVWPRALSSANNAETTARTYQGGQAMSRIIDTSTPGQIIVEDDMIPDNLSGVQWEVRRPAPTNTSRNTTDNDAFFYCHSQGGFDHQPASESASRRFRVTQKVIFKK